MGRHRSQERKAAHVGDEIGQVNPSVGALQSDASNVRPMQFVAHSAIDAPRAPEPERQSENSLIQLIFLRRQGPVAVALVVDPTAEAPRFRLLQIS